MRKTTTKLSKVKVGNGQRLWCVTWPKIGKGRNRQFFKDKAEAETVLEQKRIEQENYGTAGLSFNERERVEYRECTEKLRPLGKTISDAVAHYVAHLEATDKSCTAAQLVEQVIAAKKKACGKRGLPASERYIEDLESRLSRFKKDFDGKPAATITSEELEDWLLGLTDETSGEPLSPVSRSNYARVLSVAFTYAVKYKYASRNPLKGVDKPSSDNRPGVLTPEQTARLLEAASPELLPYIAIGLFAGLRRSEIERLDWSEIDFEENHIEVNKSKTGETGERNVEMLPILREWLLPLRKLKGSVIPEDFRKQFDQARIAAGIDEWPDNALRHSFASYYLQHFNDDRKLKLEMGHWRDSDVLFKHYRRAVKKRDAERYWTIRPTTTENILPLVAQCSL